MALLITSSVLSSLIPSCPAKFYRPTIVARTMKSPPNFPGPRSSRKLTTRASNGVDLVGSAGISDLIQNIPAWGIPVMTAICFFPLPFYKELLRIEGEVERDAETVVETVETVAEVVEKIAADVADAIPGDGRIKQLALEAEHIAEEVAKDAEQVEVFLHKVHEIEKEVEKLVEPTAEKTKLTVEENLEKKNTTPSKDPVATPR